MLRCHLQVNNSNKLIYSIFPTLTTVSFTWLKAYMLPLKKSLSCCRAHLLLKFTKMTKIIIAIKLNLLNCFWLFLCKFCQVLPCIPIFFCKFFWYSDFPFQLPSSFQYQILLFQTWAFNSNWQWFLFPILKSFCFFNFNILRERACVSTNGLWNSRRILYVLRTHILLTSNI